MLDKNLKNIYLGAAGGLIGFLVTFFILRVDSTFRVDLTDDHRYSLHSATMALIDSINEPVEATLFLDGELNAGFKRLQTATQDLLQECQVRGHKWHIQTLAPDEQEQKQLLQVGYQPILIHEHAQNGKTAQTTVYPYLKLTLGEKKTYINLLKNTQGLSGEENLNNSIENLEYALAEHLYSLTRTTTRRIAFLEGHDELAEEEVYDICLALSRYFQIDRGVLGTQDGVLDDYAAVIIANPQKPFDEKDKYIIDQYIMRGGRVLWCINGVQFDPNGLSEGGFTPAIPLNLNLEDQLFRYGVKVKPALLQDIQCLRVPVNVSADKEQPNFQPIPWFYAPLLLTSETSPITRHMGQVSAVFASPLEATAAQDSIIKQIVLATSSDSRIIPTPAKVDLMDFNADPQEFQYRYLPVAMTLDGCFPSVFAHRMAPRTLTTDKPTLAGSQPTKQVVISCGSVLRNEWVNQQPLPAGYDRYSKRVFSNRDLVVNLVLWLTDTRDLMELRQKQVSLRLLNQQQVNIHRTTIQMMSILIPISILALIGGLVIILKKRKYTRSCTEN